MTLMLVTTAATNKGAIALKSQLGKTVPQLAMVMPRMATIVPRVGMMTPRIAMRARPIWYTARSGVRTRGYSSTPSDKSDSTSQPASPPVKTEGASAAVIGSLLTFGVWGYLWLTVGQSDWFKAKMEKIQNINVFHTGQVEQLVQAEQIRKFEQLRHDLDNYICESQKRQKLQFPKSEPIPWDFQSSHKKQHPNDHREPLDDVLRILSQKQELEAQEKEARDQASWIKPNAESQDPMESLAARWRNPEEKAALKIWWDKLPYSERYAYESALKKYGIRWKFLTDDPFH
ncbi:MAG: hypothetical protein Q9171_001632 [Xanthocarpia ochracea]